MYVICIFRMQQRQQQCSFSQASRNAVQAIPKHAIIILQVQGNLQLTKTGKKPLPACHH